MALGAIWDEIWNEDIWNNAIWNQEVSTFVCDAFSYTDQVAVALSTTNVESGAVTFTNVTGTQTVTFTGDASLEWSKNAGVWSTGATTIVSNDTINLRLDASASYLTAVTGVVTVGSGVTSRTGSFAVVTLVDPADATSDIILGSANRRLANNIGKSING